MVTLIVADDHGCLRIGKLLYPWLFDPSIKSTKLSSYYMSISTDSQHNVKNIAFQMKTYKLQQLMRLATHPCTLNYRSVHDWMTANFLWYLNSTLLQHLTTFNRINITFFRFPISFSCILFEDRYCHKLDIMLLFRNWWKNVRLLYKDNMRTFNTSYTESFIFSSRLVQ